MGMISLALQWIFGIHNARWLNSLSSGIRYLLSASGAAVAYHGSTISHDQAVQWAGIIMVALPTIIGCARHFAWDIREAITRLIAGNPTSTAKLSAFLLLGLSVALSGCALDRSVYAEQHCGNGGTNVLIVVLQPDGGATVFSGMGTNIVRAAAQGAAAGIKE